MDRTEPRPDLVYTNEDLSFQPSNPVSPISTASQSSAVSTLNSHPEAASSSCCCCLRPIWNLVCSIFKCIGRRLFSILDCFLKCVCFCVLKKVRQEIAEKRQEQAEIREKCRQESVKKNEILASHELLFEEDISKLEARRRSLEKVQRELSEQQKQLTTNNGSLEVEDFDQQKAELEQTEIDFYKMEASLLQGISDFMIVKEKIQVEQQYQEEALQENLRFLQKASEDLNIL